MRKPQSEMISDKQAVPLTQKPNDRSSSRTGAIAHRDPGLAVRRPPQTPKYTSQKTKLAHISLFSCKALQSIPWTQGYASSATLSWTVVAAGEPPNTPEHFPVNEAAAPTFLCVGSGTHFVKASGTFVIGYPVPDTWRVWLRMKVRRMVRRLELQTAARGKGESCLCSPVTVAFSPTVRKRPVKFAS